MLQAQGAPTPTEHHPNLRPISPARAQPWLPASQPCQPGQVPHRCVLWGQTPLGMSRDPPGLSLLFILTRSCSVVEQLPQGLLRVMMYRGLEMKGNILPLKRRGIVSAVLNSETWMWKRNALQQTELCTASTSRKHRALLSCFTPWKAEHGYLPLGKTQSPCLLGEKSLL